MMIGILGILKAGSAYVPLDPSYPPERLEFMLADSEASVLLTQKSLDLRLDNSRLRHVYLDSEASIVEQKSRENFAGGASPEDLAYVIYTSGSTGKPKGVMVEHKSVVNYLFWCEEVLFGDLGSNDSAGVEHFLRCLAKTVSCSPDLRQIGLDRAIRHSDPTRPVGSDAQQAQKTGFQLRAFSLGHVTGNAHSR